MPRKGGKGNGLDKVDQAKLGKFADQLKKQLRKEFGTDEEGKTSNVQFLLIDRTRCWPHHYFTIPYDHKTQSRKELDEILDYLLANLKIATEAVSSHLKCRGYDEARVAKLLEQRLDADR